MVKLEVGKIYRTRDGRKAGPMEFSCGEYYPFTCGMITYTREGRRYMSDDSPHDIIAEWQDEPAEVIGENVRVIPINEAPYELFERMAETRRKPYENDPVSQPPHYRAHPSGIECIQITEHMGFNLGNAIKYIWRCDLKQDAVEDLKKAAWYIQREIAKREKQ